MTNISQYIFLLLWFWSNTCSLWEHKRLLSRTWPQTLEQCFWNDLNSTSSPLCVDMYLIQNRSILVQALCLVRCLLYLLLLILWRIHYMKSFSLRLFLYSVDANDQKKTACYDIDVEVEDPLKAQMSSFLLSTANQQEIASLDNKVSARLPHQCEHSGADDSISRYFLLNYRVSDFDSYYYS